MEYQLQGSDGQDRSEALVQLKDSAFWITLVLEKANKSRIFVVIDYI